MPFCKPPKDEHDIWCHHTWREVWCWVWFFLIEFAWIIFFGGMFGLMMYLLMANPVHATSM